MPRRNLIRSQIHPYHVVNQVNNREWFHLPLEVVWELFCLELAKAQLLYGIQIHAFVLMSNHFHLVVSTPGADLGEVMRELGKSVSQQSNLKSGRVGHMFRGRYKWSIIQDSGYYLNAYKYVYRNPIRAGICDLVEEYPYSTLHGLLGSTLLPFPIHKLSERLPSPFHPSDSGELLPWLNTPFKKEQEEAIRLAFRRREFKVPRN